MTVQRKLENLIHILDDLHSELARMDVRLLAELEGAGLQEEEGLQAARGAFARASAAVLRARRSTVSFQLGTGTLPEAVLAEDGPRTLIDTWIENAKGIVNQTWGLIWRAARLLPSEKEPFAAGIPISFPRARG